jgi:hypothetical protein
MRNRQNDGIYHEVAAALIDFASLAVAAVRIFMAGARLLLRRHRDRLTHRVKDETLRRTTA